ncbi:hypothetical protein OAC63_05145 [Amylibacter sp.]|jgi:hypothetical protein|nr:hypothetical protein [Amylibacter sp.]
MTISTTETFIPYNQNKDYILVDFLELRKKPEGAFHDIMVVEYLDKEYELFWDEQRSYYTGKLGKIEGFIP